MTRHVYICYKFGELPSSNLVFARLEYVQQVRLCLLVSCAA